MRTVRHKAVAEIHADVPAFPRALAPELPACSSSVRAFADRYLAQQVAMSWLTYRLSGSALLLGVVTFCQYIAVSLLAPVAGVLADRVGSPRALLITQSVMLAQALVLAALYRDRQSRRCAHRRAGDGAGPRIGV